MTMMKDAARFRGVIRKFFLIVRGDRESCDE